MINRYIKRINMQRIAIFTRPSRFVTRAILIFRVCFSLPITKLAFIKNQWCKYHDDFTTISVRFECLQRYFCVLPGRVGLLHKRSSHFTFQGLISIKLMSKTYCLSNVFANEKLSRTPGTAIHTSRNLRW